MKQDATILHVRMPRALADEIGHVARDELCSPSLAARLLIKRGITFYQADPKRAERVARKAARGRP